jgi:hypothetical protein
MTLQEAKDILSVYRPGTEDTNDAFFAEALKMAAQDAELSRWFAAEQAFDSSVTAKLNEEGLPFGLKTALMANRRPAQSFFSLTWPRAWGLSFVAALLTLFLTVGLMDRHQGHEIMRDYRSTMVSFVDVPPNLPLKTTDLQLIRSQVEEKSHLTGIEFPRGTMPLPAVGCRSLFFHGYRVALICFHRPDNKLVHLFVIDRKAFAGAKMPQQPHYHQDGEWETAMWMKGDMIYLLATEGDEKMLNSFM